MLQTKKFEKDWRKISTILKRKESNSKHVIKYNRLFRDLLEAE